MTWQQAYTSALCAAHCTKRRFRVHRLTFTNGRSAWSYEPVEGWTP